VPTTLTPSFDDPNSFFRTRQRSEGCAFCNQNSHHIRKCNLAEEYVRSGRASIRGGCIHLPNGNPVPNDGTGRGLQAGIDSWLAGRLTSTSATPPNFAAPAREPPQHASLITSTSRIEEVADSYIFQVAGVSNLGLPADSDPDTDPDMPGLVPESDSDIDSDIPALTPESDDDSNTSDFDNIFKVFAVEKKKRARKPSRLPEAAPQKTASSSQQTSPQKSTPSAAPQSTTHVMIHPNFSHPRRIPSSSPYPCLNDHYH